MPIHRNISIITTPAAATIAAMMVSAPAASASELPEPGEPRASTSQTLTTITGAPGSDVLTGEHALEYLSRLAREAVEAAKSGTNRCDHTGPSSGTST